MMKDSKTTVSASIDLDTSVEFGRIVEELTSALGRLGIHFEAGPNGSLRQGGFELGRVISWEPGRRILVGWRQASWNPDEVTEVELRIDSIDGGSRLTLEHR